MCKVRLKEDGSGEGGSCIQKRRKERAILQRRRNEEGYGDREVSCEDYGAWCDAECSGEDNMNRMIIDRHCFRAQRQDKLRSSYQRINRSREMEV